MDIQWSDLVLENNNEELKSSGAVKVYGITGIYGDYTANLFINKLWLNMSEHVKSNEFVTYNNKTIDFRNFFIKISKVDTNLILSGFTVFDYLSYTFRIQNKKPPEDTNEFPVYLSLFQLSESILSKKTDGLTDKEKFAVVFINEILKNSLIYFVEEIDSYLTNEQIKNVGLYFLKSETTELKMLFFSFKNYRVVEFCTDVLKFKNGVIEKSYTNNEKLLPFNAQYNGSYMVDETAVAQTDAMKESVHEILLKTMTKSEQSSSDLETVEKLKNEEGKEETSESNTIDDYLSEKQLEQGYKTNEDRNEEKIGANENIERETSKLCISSRSDDILCLYGFMKDNDQHEVINSKDCNGQDENQRINNRDSLIISFDDKENLKNSILDDSTMKVNYGKSCTNENDFKSNSMEIDMHSDEITENKLYDSMKVDLNCRNDNDNQVNTNSITNLSCGKNSGKRIKIFKEEQDNFMPTEDRLSEYSSFSIKSKPKEEMDAGELKGEKETAELKGENKKSILSRDIITRQTTEELIDDNYLANLKKNNFYENLDEKYNTDFLKKGDVIINFRRPIFTYRVFSISKENHSKKIDFSVILAIFLRLFFDFFKNNFLFNLFIGFIFFIILPTLYLIYNYLIGSGYNTKLATTLLLLSMCTIINSTIVIITNNTSFYRSPNYLVYKFELKTYFFSRFNYSFALICFYILRNTCYTVIYSFLLILFLGFKFKVFGNVLILFLLFGFSFAFFDGFIMEQMLFMDTYWIFEMPVKFSLLTFSLLPLIFKYLRAEVMSTILQCAIPLSNYLLYTSGKIVNEINPDAFGNANNRILNFDLDKKVYAIIISVVVGVLLLISLFFIEKKLNRYKIK